MEEVWKKIPGLGDQYEVSSLGNVRSLDRIVPHTTLGEIKMKGKYKSMHKDSDGYLRTTLTHEGRSSDYGVHRLVAITFIPDPENKPTVNHKNGIKDDNRIENLEWATYKEQSDHAHSTGLRTYSTYHHTNRQNIARRKVRCINTGEVFDSQSAAEQHFGLYKSAISSHLNRGTNLRCGLQFDVVEEVLNSKMHSLMQEEV